jgi:hypothetical protein
MKINNLSKGGNRVHNENKELEEMLKKSAKFLRIKEHRCGSERSSQVLATACDLEGHLGLDGRFYLCDFSRFFNFE